MKKVEESKNGLLEIYALLFFTIVYYLVFLWYGPGCESAPWNPSPTDLVDISSLQSFLAKEKNISNIPMFPKPFESIKLVQEQLLIWETALNISLAISLDQFCPIRQQRIPGEIYWEDSPNGQHVMSTNVYFLAPLLLLCFCCSWLTMYSLSFLVRWCFNFFGNVKEKSKSK